jgi:hypothetical protein
VRLPISIGCVLAATLASATALACPDACSDAATAKLPWKMAWVRFDAARHAGDDVAADAAADDVIRLFGEQGISLPDEVIAYRVFERGQCDIDALVGDPLGRPDELAEGSLICRAARLPAGDEAASRELLARLLDARTERHAWHFHVFDQFARQPTLNRDALTWMVRHGLDDRSFLDDEEDALIAQVRAGRADNVAALLDLGYDANAQHARFIERPDQVTAPPPPPPVPLQAAREALATQGERALEVARVLLARGADPGKLRFHPPTADAPADPALEGAFAALLEQAAAARDPVSTEFAGVRVEDTPGGTRVYARFSIRNGSAEPLRIGAWKDDDAFLFNQLDVASHLQTRNPAGVRWEEPMVIEDGIWPSTELVIPPGKTGEAWYELDVATVLQADPRMQYRLWYRDAVPQEHVSDPFVLRDPVRPLTRGYQKKPRDWYSRY